MTFPGGNGAATYDPCSPAEIARADVLDQIDLAEGEDTDGPVHICLPSPIPPGPGRIALYSQRYRDRQDLHHAADAPLGAEPLQNPYLPESPRDRRPSELERRPSFRHRDALRKRAARKRDRDAARDATGSYPAR